MERQAGCKLFSLIISILLVCMLFFTVSAASADNNFQIKGTTLVKYTGGGGEVTVPDGVTEIGEWAFQYSPVTKVILPETLEEIRSYAFYSCAELEEITLPASLTNLEYYIDDTYGDQVTQAQVFYNNPKLQAINVAEGNQHYKSIDGVLFSADGKKLFYYPAGKNAGGRYAIPDGTEELGYTAFDGADLTAIEFPSTLTQLHSEGGDFTGVSGLLKISVAEGNSRFYTVDDVLYDRYGSLILYPAWKAGTELDKDYFPKGLTSISAFAFQDNRNLKSIEFPEGLQTVGWMAFDGAHSLKSVTLPSTLSYISGYVFGYCDKLERVTIRSNSVGFPDTELDGTGDDIFSGARSGVVLCAPADSSVQAYADRWGIAFEALDADTEAVSTEAYDLTVTDEISVQTVADSEDIASAVPTPDTIVLHTDTADITEPAEPETSGVFEVQDKTLMRYTGNEEVVTVPDGIEVLGEWAFDGCIARKIILPETLKEIQCYCFFNCPNLSDITLPASLKTLGSMQAFNITPALKRFKVAQGNKHFVSVDGVLFNADRTVLLYYPDGKNVNGTYAVPEGTTRFGGAALSGAQISVIEIPASFNGASFYNHFSSMPNLTDINVSPDNKTCKSVDGILFDNAGTLVSYPAGRKTEHLGKDDFPAETKLLGPWAFQSVHDLKTVELPDGLESIGWMCFTWVDALESITVPASVRNIDAFAFADCPNLKEVTILNPEANLRLDESKINEDYNFNIVDESPRALLCGYEGSTAQTYAEKLDLPFSSLGPAPEKDPNVNQPDPEPTPVFYPACME